MAYIPMTIGGKMSLKDIYKDIVINNPNGYTEYNITTYSATRNTVDVGKVVVDTTKKTCYIYAEITILQNIAANDYHFMGIINNLSSSCQPKSTSSSSISASLTTEQGSKGFAAGYWSQYGFVFFKAYGNSLSANDKYTVYGSWMYQ